MIDSPDFRLSDRPVQPPGHLPWYRRFAKQIVFSVIGSMIAGMIINATSLVMVVRYGSAMVSRVLGDPFSGRKFPWEEIENKARHTVNHPPATVPLPVSPVPPLPGQMANLAKHHEEEQRKKFIARADAVGLKYDDDWDLAKFKVEVPKAEDKFKEAEERKPLLAQARELKMVVDPDWDNKMLKAEIMEERAFQRADETYQEQRRRYQEALSQREQVMAHGPNTRCPTPKCGYGFRTHRTKGTFICPKCRNIYPITQARACYTPPPMPREPFPPQRKAPGLLKRTFG